MLESGIFNLPTVKIAIEEAIAPNEELLTIRSEMPDVLVQINKINVRKENE